MEYRTVVSVWVFCVLYLGCAAVEKETEKTCRTIPDTVDYAIKCYCAYTLYNRSWTTCEQNVTGECFPLKTYIDFIFEHDERKGNDEKSKPGKASTAHSTKSNLKNSTMSSVENSTTSQENDDVYRINIKMSYEECLDYILTVDQDVLQLTRSQTVYSKTTVVAIACTTGFAGILVGCLMAVLFRRFTSVGRKNKPDKTTLNVKEMEEDIGKKQVVLNDSHPEELDKLISESEQIQTVEQQFDKDEGEILDEVDGEKSHRYDALVPFGSERIRGSLHLYRDLKSPGQPLYMSMDSDNEGNNLDGDQANIADRDLALDKPNMVSTGLSESDSLVHTNEKNLSREEMIYVNTDEVLDEHSINDADLYENVDTHSTQSK